jgi:hypothetical protein
MFFSVEGGGRSAAEKELDEDLPAPATVLQRSHPGQPDPDPSVVETRGGGSAHARPADDQAPPPPAASDLSVEGDLYVGSQVYLPNDAVWWERVSAVGFLLGSEREADEWERSTAGFGYIRAPQTGNLDLYLLAPIRVPLAAEPLDAKCHIYDHADPANVTIYFTLHQRVEESHWTSWIGTYTNFGQETDVLDVPFSLGSVPGTRAADEYWWMEVRWQPDAAGDGLRFYGCSVELSTDKLTP